MTNLLRATGSFVIVLVAYWAYALTAVPLIEPSLDTHDAAPISDEALQRAANRTKGQLDELAVLFPPGSLKIDNPKVIQSDRVKLLIGEYTNQQGNVELNPCIIIYLPEPKKGMTSEEQIRQAMVLEAPRGAVLKFDESFNIGRGEFGRLESGRFNGPITIRRAGKTNKPDDNLFVTTRDVYLTEEHITTNARVEFRQGPHYGSGRGMRIKLLPGDDIGMDKKKRGPNIAGIESFELLRLDRMCLQLPQKSMSFDTLGSPQQAMAPQAGGAGKPATMPVEISCDGSFRFHAVRQEASFEKRVVVTATRAVGEAPARIENCDRLTVRFVQRPVSGTTAEENAIGKRREKTSNIDNLQPSLIVAVGNPAVIRVPSESAEGRAQCLKYDLINQDLTLEGEVPVYLRQGMREIEARHLRYWSPEPPWQLGRVVAAGPGWIRAQVDDQPNKLFEARWNNELRIQPFEQNQVISLTGGASLSHGGIGNLTAGEIYFYLFELPPLAGSRRVRLHPDRMSATTDVRLDSPRISGNIEELGVWFEQDANNAGPPIAQNEWTSVTPSKGPAAPGSRGMQPTATNTADQQHYRINARKLNARVILRKPKPEVAELTIEDHVTLVETKTAKVDDEPVVISGESIHVQYASQPHATLGIKGNAKFQGRGLALSGPSIHVNRGTNRLKVPGPGWMDLPPMKQHDAQGQLIGDSGPVRVKWEEGMEFDGRTATFNGKVRAVSQMRKLSADTMAATLDRMIRFANMEKFDGQPSPDLQELHCEGQGPQSPVWMESRTFKEGRQDSYVFIEAQNLNLNNASGALAAGGPGSLRSVSFSSKGMDQWGGLTGSKTAKPDEAADAQKKDTLKYLHVQFLGGIRGNVDRREMTFHDQVRAVFGPVETWEDTIPEDDPDAWGPEGGLLSTNQLTVREMPSPISTKDSTTELEAIGNTRIEGQEFAAFCTRLCYDQSKDMIFLQGDGRSKVTLLRQKRGSGSRAEVPADWFKFWPKTNIVHSGGFGSAVIRQSTGPAPRAR